MKRIVVLSGVALLCALTAVWGVKVGVRSLRHAMRANLSTVPADPGVVEGEDSLLASNPSSTATPPSAEQLLTTPEDSASAAQSEQIAPPAAALNESQARARYLELLEEGMHRLQERRDYSATFYRHERVNGELQDPSTSVLKVRHQPFSIHLSWLGNRREVTYVEGQNYNKLLVRDDTLPRPLSRMQLDPTGYIAMAESRYPVTKLGLAPLSQTLIEYRKRDLTLIGDIVCRMLNEAKFDGRECYGFVVEYAHAGVEPVYRKSVVYLDKELLLPVFVKNYGWPDASVGGQGTDEDTLIEHYTYRDLKFDLGLADPDFTVKPRTAATTDAAGG